MNGSITKFFSLPFAAPIWIMQKQSNINIYNMYTGNNPVCEIYMKIYR